jgi:DNA-binding NarL/FixJ family response regulator
MIRLLLADDHTIVREGLRRIVAETRDITVVAEAASGPEVLQRARAERPDVVVLDLSMPGRGGLETLQDLKRLRPPPHVLVLSMYPEDQYGPRLLKEGADGYMTKESAPDLLIGAIRKIHAGGKYVSPALAEKLAFSLDARFDRPLHDSLSAREFQVARLIASGRTGGEIAAELNLSAKTVSTYRTRILEKLSLRNNAEIMQYLMRHKLVE